MHKFKQIIAPRHTDLIAQIVKRPNQMPDQMSDKISDQNKEAGFTLLEVMVTLVIIGLLTTFVVINVAPAQGTAKVQKAKGDIRLLESALEQYRLDIGSYPDEDFGLEALSELPPGVDNEDRYRAGGYIRSLPNDPWGAPYIYIYPGENGVYDIISYGSDGQPDGEGLAADIVSWEP